MSAWLGEGQTRWLNCPRCDEVILTAQCGGLTAKLSRWSVPLSHASILVQYGMCVWNVWRGMSRWFVTEWCTPGRFPSRGRLYIEHLCSVRK